MVHIQNSTLAGGVAIGTLAGMISVLGFNFILPRLQGTRIHDTCGVNNLHGIPGIMSGITGIIVASMGTHSGFLNHLTDTCLSGGTFRNFSTQAGYQAAALGLTIGMAIVGRLIAGIILRLPIFAQKDQYFDDELNWHLPDLVIDEKNYQYEKTNPSTLL